MKTLVVLFVFAAVAHASLLNLAQPAHHPAVVVDARGRPLDTAEVIEARALHLQAKALEAHHAPVVAAVAHSVAVPAVVAAPAAVSHQSRVDVHSSPAIVSHAVATPVLAHAAAPVFAHSALGLAGHGHYLKKRSLSHLAYAVPAIVPAAVSHQSRVDVHSSPAIVSHAVATPVLAHAAAPVFAHSALSLAGHGHYLKKRSLSHLAYAVPAIAPAAVSHQSRVDVISSPAVVSRAVVAPVAHAVATPVVAHAIAAPAIAVAPAAVSHQSRVDVRTSPAVVAHAPVAAVSHAVVAAPVYGAHALSHGHLLKKRSLAAVVAPVVHAVPAAVSHQSRVDVISEPAVVAHAAPVTVAHVAPAVVAAPVATSHQSRVDVISSAVHAAPLAHSAVWTAPVARLTNAGLVNAHSLW